MLPAKMVTWHAWSSCDAAVRPFANSHEKVVLTVHKVLLNTRIAVAGRLRTDGRRLDAAADHAGSQSAVLGIRLRDTETASCVQGDVSSDTSVLVLSSRSKNSRQL